MEIYVGILIGGHSRRMGRPKALIVADGETLIERTVRLAKTLSDRVVLLGKPPFPLPTAVADLTVLGDARTDGGPIGGLASLLRISGIRPALLLACDLPRLDAPLLKQLLDAVTHDVDAVAFATGLTPAEWEPCCAVYLPSAMSRVESQIERRDYSLQSLLALLRTKTVFLSKNDAPLLANLNTPADMPAGYD